MSKINNHIEIVRSSIPSLSSMGAQSCEMIRQKLSEYYEDVGISIVNDSNDLDRLIDKHPDLAILGVKKVPIVNRLNDDLSNFVWISEYLDYFGINYSGSNAKAVNLDFNKSEAKDVISNAGLKTTDYFMANKNQFSKRDELPLNYPLFLKPPHTGGGKGIDSSSVVHNFKSFNRKVKSINKQFNSATLVEDYLTGREFSVAIMDDINSDKLIAMPIELIAKENDFGDKILSHEIKSEDSERVIAIEDSVIKNQITDLAIKVYKSLGARDYGRIDIRLDGNGIPNFMEANLVPGLAFHSFTSYFTSACMINEDMDYESMILGLTELGLNRNKINNEAESLKELITLTA